ncbi:hypothetical protein KDL01_21040 [Actinospica durhamensis]|uniref:Uncharacterized protein n=1 Tax=Actinospica durhamensis TaxID=1508375 RepID=A0A941EPY4_9ACTN|nr:hypothetical protein [Actinospica durhamensis]MBR7835772.1 hypothetical protein [Actinospica durhamensis]
MDLPTQPHPFMLDHHRLNPTLLEPGTYAIDEAEVGSERVAGSFVLAPGDLRGVRFVYERVLIGCWSLSGQRPCLACEGCAALVACRADDCHVAQEARFLPDLVTREDCGEERQSPPAPFALIADWDEAPVDTRRSGWVPKPARPRPELTATRWRARGLKSETFRDDPPA